jgi:diaminopimelate decarboxylase
MTSARALYRATARQQAVAQAVRDGLLGPTAPVVGLLDVDGILDSVAGLKAAFADAPVQHTFAVKACALAPVLRLLAHEGLGAEVASAGELALALAAGFDPRRLVFDSPAKTVGELAHALDLGIAVNADNFQELERLDALLGPGGPAGPVGLRVNPQVGAGSVAATSTATTTSKFGVTLRDPGAVEAVVAAFAQRPWLTRLHAHIGSLGCPPALLAAGVGAAHDLAEQVNSALGRRQVTGLDIGGGLPVGFADDEDDPGFADYAAELRSAAPGLFDGRYTVVTEFGRALLAKNGTVASVVEYTKTAGGRRIAVTHAGAQVATRAMAMPEAWPLRVLAFDAQGRPKGGPTAPHDIAGPCCFSGDLTAVGRTLPVLEPGDLVALCDTGAYSFSAHFSYNSLPRPAVHGYRAAPGGGVRLVPVRSAQSIDQVVADSGADHLESLTRR